MEDDTSTLTIEGFTPYAQVPRWVLRSGGRLSNGARALYGDIMTYASNDAKTAFPSRETLAQDLGVSIRSITTYVKELEEFGALRVERRRNKRTGNFYANQYALIFTDPSAADCTRREEAHFPVTTPTNSTTPTTPNAVPVPATKISPSRSPSLSEQRRDQKRTLLGLVLEMAYAPDDETFDAAVTIFQEEWEAVNGLGAQDVGNAIVNKRWGERLDEVTDRLSAGEWLGMFTNWVQKVA